MIPALKFNRDTAVDDLTRPCNGHEGTADESQEMALLALSHTPIEHQLYESMRVETLPAGTRIGAFSARHLMMLTGLSCYSTIRRGLLGLQSKLSIEHHKVAGDIGPQQSASVYYIFTPAEILRRRRAANLSPYPKEIRACEGNIAFGSVIERIIQHDNLSRREAQVALCCVEGLTNAEISKRLCISEDTAKTHLRHVFVKCGVRRRTELISRLVGIKAERNLLDISANSNSY
jgi:DNA-binding CsgD family transcriptional regulator